MVQLGLTGYLLSSIPRYCNAQSSMRKGACFLKKRTLLCSEQVCTALLCLIGVCCVQVLGLPKDAKYRADAKTDLIMKVLGLKQVEHVPVAALTPDELRRLSVAEMRAGIYTGRFRRVVLASDRCEKCRAGNVAEAGDTVEKTVAFAQHSDVPNLTVDFRIVRWNGVVRPTNCLR
jgi:hypothetical protein